MADVQNNHPCGLNRERVKFSTRRKTLYLRIYTVLRNSVSINFACVDRKLRHIEPIVFQLVQIGLVPVCSLYPDENAEQKRLRIQGVILGVEIQNADNSIVFVPLVRVLRFFFFLLLLLDVSKVVRSCTCYKSTSASICIVCT